MSDLEAAHLVNRDIGAQDFEAYSLFLGLSRYRRREPCPGAVARFPESVQALQATTFERAPSRESEFRPP